MILADFNFNFFSSLLTQLSALFVRKPTLQKTTALLLEIQTFFPKNIIYCGKKNAN